MNFCPNCGSEISLEALFCANCGQKLSRNTPSGANQPQAQTSPPNQQPESSRRTGSPHHSSSPPRGQPRAQEGQNRPSRRGFIYGGLGILTLSGLAGGFYIWAQEGPEENAEAFVEAIGNGDFSAANDLIHPSATIDGAGAAVDLISAWKGVDVIFEVADVSVVGSSVVEESDTEAVVSVSVNVDFQVQETTGDIGVVMREEDDWYVWNLRI